MTQTPGCNRFETESREPYDDDPEFAAHLKRCDDCRTVQTAHLRIAHAIGLMHQRAAPPRGWKERVLEKIEELEAAGDRSSGEREAIPPAAPQPEQQRPRRLSKAT